MEIHLIDDYMQHLRNKGLALSTCLDRRFNLTSFATWLECEAVFSFFAVEPETINAYHRAVKEGSYGAYTGWKRLHAVWAFYEWLKDTGRILLNPAPHPRSGRSRPLPRAIPSWMELEPTLRRLRKRPGPVAQRDYALIDLAYCCGLRRCELHRLNIEDINVHESTLRVTGKDGKQRVVPIGKRTLDDLLYYIYNMRPRLVKASLTHALFVSWIGGGKRMHRYSINAVFRRLRRTCGLPKSIRPHALRHAFATDLVRNGAPVQDVSKMLGHKKLETTQIYTRLLPLHLKDHHRKYHPRG